jgi:hypothetical protein
VTAWSQRILSELEASDRRVRSLASSLTIEQLNWTPAPGAWSVGQCLKHLHLANEVYLPAISAALGDGQRLPVEKIVIGWFGRWFIRGFIEPSPVTRRAKAPKKIAPPETIGASVVDQFLRSNQDARELVAKAGDYDVNRIRFRNPFVPLMRFTVGTGLEIIAKHQNRHLLQAERVGQSAGFPAAL